MVSHMSSKRNSFSANWEVNSSLTQEIHEVGNWAKDGMDSEKEGRMSRQSSNWDQNESSIMTGSEMPHRASVTSNDRWEMESKVYMDKKRHSNENIDRPTFRTHQMNRSQQEREKKHSVSTQNTDKQDKLEGNLFLLFIVYLR